MSFRNGDKARSGRLRKQRDRMRMKTRALRAALTAPTTASADSSEGVVKTIAVAEATPPSSSEA
jgi:hypothetical protein